MASGIPTIQLLLALTLILSTSLFLRLLYILPSTNPTRAVARARRRHTPTRLLVVLGSGGHSAEMFAILGNIDPSLYTRRSYVVSFGDDLSARRAEEFEASLPEGQARTSESCVPSTYDISFIPRARAIHQSLLTTPPSALRCLAACFGVLHHPARSSDVDAGFRSDYPDLIITNGPGTAVCMIAASFIIRFFSPILPRDLQSGRAGRGSMRTIYVESWARVKGLSLSGKLLVKVVDRFLVQWQGLQGVGGRGEYVGLLV